MRKEEKGSFVGEDVSNKNKEGKRGREKGSEWGSRELLNLMVGKNRWLQERRDPGGERKREGKPRGKEKKDPRGRWPWGSAFSNDSKKRENKKRRAEKPVSQGKEPETVGRKMTAN